jgi:tetratricopeptide (TPR) repeat protein
MPRRVLTLLVLLLATLFCLTPLAEVDAFWHLLTGEQILATGRVPRADTFTYTSAGRPWIDLHWLFQAALAVFHRIGGFQALDLFKTVVIVCAFGVALWTASRRGAGVAAPLLAIPGLVAAQERFTLRPEAVSFLLLAVVLFLLEGRTRSWRRLFLLPFLVALWVNLHALYAVGVAAILLVLLGDLLDRRRLGDPLADPGHGGRNPGRSLLLAAACVLATLLNPYGFGAWGLSRTLLMERVATGNLFGRTIAEFQAPFSGFGATASITGFAVLAAAVVIVMLAGWRASTSADRLLIAAFLSLALLARRNMPLFALVTLPAAGPAGAASWRRLVRWLGRMGRPAGLATAVGEALPAILGCLCAFALILDVASNRFFARDGTQRGLGTGVAAGIFPEASADWVAEQRPAGEVFHDMSAGGYLAWRWWPRRRTYIDGRLEVHSPELFAAYLKAEQDPGRFEAEARARDIRVVLWSHAQVLEAAPLLKHLASDPAWRLVHLDLAASIFARRDAFPEGAAPPAIDPRSAPVLQALLAEADEVERRTRLQDPMPAFLRRLVPRRDVPAAEVGAGLFLALAGAPSAAARLLDDAARRAPWSAPLQYDVGLALTGSGNDDEARRRFEAALRIDPTLMDARAALGLLDLRAGDENGAFAQWSEAERWGSLPPAALQARGALLARKGALDEAIRDYRKALRGAPGRDDWRGDLALILEARGRPREADTEIAEAVRDAARPCGPRTAGARLTRARGHRDDALRAALDVLGSDPDCQEARLEAARILVELGRSDEAGGMVSEALRRGLDRRTLAEDPLLGPLMERP